MVSKAAGTLTQIEAVAPNCKRPHILHHYVIEIKNNASFKNILDKNKKIISFNNSQPFGTCLLLFCVMK